MTGAPLLRVSGLHVDYAGKNRMLQPSAAPIQAVQGLDLEVRRGQIHGLAGESGSGKSTLARSLVQLIAPSAGAIELDGLSVNASERAGKRQARRRIQLIFQDPGSSLSPRRTIAQSLREPARHFGLDYSDAHLVSILHAVGLDASALKRQPRAFSSGQRQRIAIARALVCEPDLLIADEALAALDVSVQAQVMELLRNLCKERDMGILLISHDLAVLRENAQVLSIMYRGRIVEQGLSERVFESPAHPYTRQLLAALPRLDPALPRANSDPGAGLAERHSGPGCVFQHRCTLVKKQCRTIMPQRRAVPAHTEHHVECHVDQYGLELIAEPGGSKEAT